MFGGAVHYDVVNVYGSYAPIPLILGLRILKKNLFYADREPAAGAITRGGAVGIGIDQDDTVFALPAAGTRAVYIRKLRREIHGAGGFPATGFQACNSDYHEHLLEPWRRSFTPSCSITVSKTESMPTERVCPSIYPAIYPAICPAAFEPPDLDSKATRSICFAISSTGRMKSI